MRWLKRQPHVQSFKWSLMAKFNKSEAVAIELLGHEALLSLALVIQSKLLPPLLVIGGLLFFGYAIYFLLWKRNMKMLGDDVVDEAAEDEHLDH